MFLSFGTYRIILVIALTVLMAVPCVAKKEKKQWLNIKTSQQSSPIQQLTACNAFCQLQKHDKKEKTGKHIVAVPASGVEKDDSGFAATIPLPDFYTRQKEIISSYLLFERFLI